MINKNDEKYKGDDDNNNKNNNNLMPEQLNKRKIN